MTGREQHTVKNLLENLAKATRIQGGLVISVAPRGGLQISQPANVSDALIKAYARGFETEDRLTWGAILKRKPIRPSDVYGRGQFDETPFAAEMLLAQRFKHAIALPLASPLLEGYPGVVHVFRTAEEGDFTGKDVEAMMNVVHQFDAKRNSTRETARSRGACSPNSLPADGLSFAILDGKMKPQFNAPSFNSIDGRVREQIVEHAKRRMHQMNGHGFAADRVQLPDSHGDVTVYRVAAFKRFTALGEGPFVLLCRQPGCSDWSALKPQDFSADGELSRLIPALKYMQQEFSKGPTLVDIARQVHLSPFHFHRRFTELLGLTPKQFLLECQIHQSKSDLLSGDKELASIAKECGFAHQSHFTSRFKQTTGLTPTRWRRMMSERANAN